MGHFARIALIGLAASGLTVGGCAYAQRPTIPLNNRDNIRIETASGKTLDLETVKKVIVRAGVTGQRKWDFVAGGGDALRGTYRVRTHMVSVEVIPTATAFSLRYLDSSNMKYSSGPEGTFIHPYYDLWVSQLLNDIRAEFQKY